jgi:hypothetical protein
LTRDEYRELADLWGESAPVGDQQEVERLARTTPRRARMAQWGELAVVALLFAAIGASVVSSLGPGTMLTGSLLLVLLGWSAWKRHQLANLALLIDQSDRLSFVRSSVQAKEAELRRSGLGLALILPGVVIALLWGFSLRHPDGGVELGDFLLAVITAPRGLVTYGCVIAAVVILSVLHVRLRGELAELRRLQQQYADEARRDDFAGW